MRLLADSAEGVGYLLKDRVSEVKEFIAALRRVADGGSALDPTIVSTMLKRHRSSDPLDSLTPREREVLELMATGASNAGIAESMVITQRAAEKYVSTIFTKLGIPATGASRGGCLPYSSSSGPGLPDQPPQARKVGGAGESLSPCLGMWRFWENVTAPCTTEVLVRRPQWRFPMADRSAPAYEWGESDRLPRIITRSTTGSLGSDFVELRRRYLSFAFPATIAFMAWYILYIVCNNWARLHGHRGPPEHQRRVGVGIAAVRFDLCHRLLLCPARQQVAGSAGFEITGRVRPGGRAMSAAMLVPLVAGDTLTIVLFLAVVALTLYITFWASRQSKTTTDYYAGGRSFSGFQNGLAVSGDYMSAASFLGISGAIAIYGYDGFLYSIGFLVAWLVALLLIAELLRNSGRFTMADQLAYRMRQTPVRSAAATSTIVVSIFYLLAQMVGAGSLVGLLLGVDSPALKNLVIVGVGVLMIIYVTFGGMKGTTCRSSRPCC